MDWINVSLTSLSMAVDAMTVGAVDGIHERHMPIWKVLFIALVFGVLQMAMPIVGFFVGYFIGAAIGEQFEHWIPWIAFALLALLSLKSFFDFFKERRERRKGQADKPRTEKTTTVPEILLQGVATSIDAFCIGFVYLNLSIPDAMLTFGIIGIVTFVLSFLTTFFGSKVAGKLEKWGSLLSGVVFLAVGLKILLEGIL